MNKKVSILFVSHFGTKNLGDELLLLSEIELLNNVFENGIIPYVYSYNTNTSYYKNSNYNIKQIQRFNLKFFFKSIFQIISCVKKTDLIIVGGGGIIQDK